MQHAHAGEQKRAADRAGIEQILAGYPAIASEDMDTLVQYFGKQASSLDVALLSISELCGDQYRQFRLDQAARLRSPMRDRLVPILIAFLIAITILLLWDLGR